ncbi:MAG: head GIN domain-containing protein [Anaerolineae bacterium]
MKKSIILGIVLALVATSLACTITLPDINIDIDVEKVEGSGNVIEENRDVRDFSRVRLAGFGRLHIERGDTESLRIEAEDNLLQYITTEVEDGELDIRWQKNILATNRQPINFYLTVKTLDTITLDGAGDIEASNMRAETFTVNANGAGNFNLSDLNVDTLFVTLSGAGNVTLTGEATTQTVKINGLGNYQARDLWSTTAKVEINAAGSATVRVSEKLDATINGAGSIYYYGNPTVSQRVAGVGKISRIED